MADREDWNEEECRFCGLLIIYRDGQWVDRTGLEHCHDTSGQNHAPIVERQR